MLEKADLDTFVRSILSDSAFELQLRDITDRNEFVSKVVELGSQTGYDFSISDVEEEMRRNRQQWLKT